MQFHWDTEGKLRAVSLLFGLRALLYLIDGAFAILASGSYADYGNAFVMSAIYFYIAYTLQKSQKRMTLLMAQFFAGVIIVRVAMMLALSLTGDVISAMEVAVAIAYVVVFGILPLVVLLQKDVRSRFA